MSQQLNASLKTLTMPEIIDAVSVQNSTDTHSCIISAAQDKAAHIKNLCLASPTSLEIALKQLTVKEILTTLHEFKLPIADKFFQNAVLLAADTKAARLRDDEERQLKKVCLQQARDISVKTSFLEEVGDSVQNSQQLVQGMLLYNPAITTKDDEQLGFFCEKCFDDIKSNKTPALSLANNLWVGEIPDELTMLTLPEQDNIALFPENGIPDVITASVQHLEDIMVVDSEREDYVPEDDSQDYSVNKAFLTGKDTVEDSIVNDTVQSHVLLDSNVSDVDDEQLLAHTLCNISEQYRIQRGSTFVNEYPHRNADQTLSIGDSANPNHLLGAFPCLFPYAAGGFEIQRPRPVTYEAHAQWAMCYADRRYRKDLHFMFQVFSVIQKRQHLTAVRSKVMGTDKSRTKIRSLIWGMSVMKNPPSLWITINPTDTHDPIAQVFTRAEIDLDHFQRLAAILEELFGIRLSQVVRGRVICKRRAPLQLQDTAWIDSKGRWGPKRTFTMMNNWNPTILLATRANHDIRLITNGEETKISDSTFQYVQELNKHLIQRCANLLSREQEFSAPEVVTYLMKWEDQYILHHFETIYFSSVINLLKKTWPQLVSQSHVAKLSSTGELHDWPDSAQAFDAEYAVLHFEEETQSLQLSMLALLQPWRSLPDLKPAHLTFEDAFNVFTRAASVDVLNIIENVQYFYECSDQVRERQVNRAFDSAWGIAAAETTQTDEDDAEEGIDDALGEEDSDDKSSARIITESDIENALQDCHSTREMLYADVAVNIAEDFAIFGDDAVQIVSCPPRRIVTAKEMEMCMQWQEIIKHGHGANLKPVEEDKHNVGAVTTTLLPLSSNNNRPRTVELEVDTTLSNAIANCAT
ncbi:hypothetical protein DFJ58DRAFT_840361 [Suillus subalutaceus]|uniref:uncharacterized protein n=1 Tax=Suillus subalutaceus TaxID=48586 RepID=UPI001B886067|nr:uncharacterized protein DFJ58DRAFT_840361 [Suillus subalutaceus]KAG1858776.1 hypothetical protein DFJ58DRAFT_840361 [Suillus subalutaceus]